MYKNHDVVCQMCLVFLVAFELTWVRNYYSTLGVALPCGVSCRRESRAMGALIRRGISLASYQHDSPMWFELLRQANSLETKKGRLCHSFWELYFQPLDDKTCESRFFICVSYWKFFDPTIDDSKKIPNM